MPQLVEGRTGTDDQGRRVIVRNGRIDLMDAPAPSAAPASAPSGLTRLPDGSLITGMGPRGGAPSRVSGLSVQEQKALAEMRRTGAALRTDLADTERFARLADQQQTGGMMSLPLVGGLIADTVAAYDPQIDEMREITARLTPAQRPAGSGATSDFEQRLYGQSVPSVRRTPQANEAVINRGRSRAGEAQLRAEFMDSWASQRGTLQGAEQAWNNIYQPPPVEAGSPEPRANVRPTEAQRTFIEGMRGRNRTAPLGSPNNPRVPPRGYDVTRLPDGDWYVTPDGRLSQAGTRERGNARLRNQSGRSNVTVRRVQ